MSLAVMLDLFIEVAEVIHLRFGIGGFTGNRFGEVVELIGLLRVEYLLVGVAPFIDERRVVGDQVV